MTVTDNRILEVLARIEDKVTSHGERLDSHGNRLDAHDSILKSHTDQLVAHGQMLTSHARMHTEHAERIIAAQESARTAKQSSSDLAKESAAALEAIGRHVSTAERMNEAKLDAIVAANTRAEEQRALQTATLGKLLDWQKSRWFRVAVVIGALVGGALAGYLGAHGSDTAQHILPR